MALASELNFVIPETVQARGATTDCMMHTHVKKTKTNPPHDLTNLPPPVPVDQGVGRRPPPPPPPPLLLILYHIPMLAIIGACVLNVDPVPLSPAQLRTRAQLAAILDAAMGYAIHSETDRDIVPE